MLTSSQRREYLANGYIILNQIIDLETIQKLQTAFDDVAKREFWSDGSRYFSAERREKLAEGGHYALSLEFMDEKERAFAELIGYPPLVEAVQDLFGADIRFYHAALSANIGPRRGRPEPLDPAAPFPAHRDVNTTHPVNYAICGIYLDEISAEIGNAPISVLPGSHRECVVDFPSGKVLKGDKSKYTNRERVVVHSRPGDVVIFTPWLLHNIDPNVAGLTRRALFYRYRDACAIFRSIPEDPHAPSKLTDPPYSAYLKCLDIPNKDLVLRSAQPWYDDVPEACSRRK
jgi:ectoine hydroxylase-related dioxygenase (phytanoyl-CoA dioxygenase family)